MAEQLNDKGAYWMKTRMKHIILVAIIIIIALIILCLYIVLNGNKIRSDLSEEYSSSLVSSIIVDQLDEWGVDSIDIIGKRIYTLDKNKAYWEILNNKNVILMCNNDEYQWCIAKRLGHRVPELSDAISQIEIADSKIANEFYFEDGFKWQSINSYKLNVSEDCKKQIISLISQEYIDTDDDNTVVLTCEEASKNQIFYIRIFYKDFENVFYSPSNCFFMSDGNKWTFIIQSPKSNKYVAYPLSDEIASTLDDIDLEPVGDYKVTWYGG